MPGIVTLTHTARISSYFVDEFGMFRSGLQASSVRVSGMRREAVARAGSLAGSVKTGSEDAALLCGWMDGCSS